MCSAVPPQFADFSHHKNSGAQRSRPDHHRDLAVTGLPCRSTDHQGWFSSALPPGDFSGDFLGRLAPCISFSIRLLSAYYSKRNCAWIIQLRLHQVKQGLPHSLLNESILVHLSNSSIDVLVVRRRKECVMFTKIRVIFHPGHQPAGRQGVLHRRARSQSRGGYPLRHGR